MAIPFSLDPARTAVLSMDLQTAIVARYAGDQNGLIARAASVLERARDLGCCVIHIQVGFRPGLPEVHPRNALFGAIKSSPQYQRMFQGPGGAIHPAVAPVGEEIVVTKHRVNSFAGTDLEMILRAREIDTLVLFGIATSGVVLSTVLDASDGDYRLVVIRDCCADLDAELHACLMEKLLSRRASLVNADEFLDSAKEG